MVIVMVEQDSFNGNKTQQDNTAVSQHACQNCGALYGQQGQHEGGRHGGQVGHHLQFYQVLRNSQQQHNLYPDLSNMFGVLGAPGAPNPNL